MSASEIRRTPLNHPSQRESAIDLSALSSLGGSLLQAGSERFLGDVIELFLRLGPANYAVARAALAHRDGPSLARAVHKLKSQAAYFGARRLVQVCRDLETFSYRGQLSACEPLLEDLEDELDRVVAALLNFEATLRP